MKAEREKQIVFSNLVERHVLPAANGEVLLPSILFAIATAWPLPELHILVESPLTDGVYSRAALQDLSRRGCCTSFEEW